MKVFISYNSCDKFAATIFELWIRESGFIPLRDDLFLGPRPITSQLEEHLRECDVFLAVLSPEFYKSRWTRKELDMAFRWNKRVLFVAITQKCIPRKPYNETKPLELWRMDSSIWRTELIRSIGDLASGRGIERDVTLDQWFSRNYGCNQWIQERAAYEQLSFSHLIVSSSVELASKAAGWSADTIVAHESGEFRLEPEAAELLRDPTTSTGGRTLENFALKSLREDLSDEPYLSLNFQRVSHGLVREVASNFPTIFNALTPPRHLFESGNFPYPHSVVTHMVLVTLDNFVIIGQRSSRPRFYENVWAVSYEEHMNSSLDGANPFSTAIRGLKEELIGEYDEGKQLDNIHFFSVFREFDHWTNIEREESFWNINIGLAGLIRVPLPVSEIFRNWLHVAEDRREFRHLIAIPYNFENLFQLLDMGDDFNPAIFGSTLLVPPGVDRRFPDLIGKPAWRRQHPTNRIRLIRCLTYEFQDSVQDKVRSLGSALLAPLPSLKR